MSDPQFRQSQWEARYDPHIAPINRLVDELQRERGAKMPYVAPHYAGIKAELLFIFQDPGPMTDDSRGGSGFLCAENDDPTAQLFSECLDQVGLTPDRIITWNASPWLRPDPKEKLTPRELEAGIEPTMRLLALLPKLRVVMLMGGEARNGWARLRKQHPAVQDRYHVLESLHPSGRGITNGSRHTKAIGVEKVIQSMRKALPIIDSQ